MKKLILLLIITLMIFTNVVAQKNESSGKSQPIKISSEESYEKDAPQIKYVKAFRVDDSIEVDYVIKKSKFYNQHYVTLYVSKDEGDTWEGPLKEVTGDIGDSIKGGGHTAIWAFKKEMPMINDELIFDVRVKTQELDITKSKFMQYIGNQLTPVGFRYGQLSKCGYYVQGRVSPGVFKEKNYEYSRSIIDVYKQAGYYRFSGETGIYAMSITLGTIFQTTMNSYIYAGLGYGLQENTAEINEYQYNEEKLSGTSWVVDSGKSYEGLDFEAGFMIRFKKVLVSLGATSINAQTINFTAGVGITI